MRRWIWLRGLARNSKHWGPFLEEFKKTFPEDQIEMLDTRGNGSESHIPSYLSIEENWRDLRSRSQLIKEGPVHFLTVSLGAMIAFDWAAHFPEEFMSLTAINTSDSTSGKFYDRLRPQNYGKLLDTILHPQDNFRIESNVMSMTAPRTAEAQKWISEFAKVPPASLANLLRQLYAASQFRLPKEKPPTEVLLLGGRKDGFVNPACTQKIADAWRITAEWHEEAGHDICLEDPAWVCEKLRRF